MQTNEVWRDIKNFEGKYQVSNLGRVKSLSFKRTGKSRILSAPINSRGYKCVLLYMNGKRFNSTVHRLVAETFISCNSDGLVVDHIDRNKTNNNLTNLRFITQRQNSRNIDKRKTSSKFHQVSFCKQQKKWLSWTTIKGKRKNIGRFNCETRAFFESLKYAK